MGKLETTPTGPMRGTVGDMIVYQWNGMWCTRKRPTHHSDAKSDAQKKQRSAFRVGVHLAACMNEVLNLNLRESARARHMTAYNLFMKINSGCFRREGDEVEVQWDALKLSEGPLAGVKFVGVEMNADGLVTARFKSETDECSAFDNVRLYAYAPQSEKGELSTPVHRQDGVATLQLPAEMLGGEVHLYGFVRNDENAASDSVYAGCLAPGR